MRIGIFDSGIGGISVLHEAYHHIGDADYLFYADTDHVPYGSRTNEEILSYAKEITSFLLEKGAEVILIACNTATSVAAAELRRTLPVPIVAMEPAVKPAVLQNPEGKRVLVMATPVTIREDKLHDLLERVDRGHAADLLAMPKLVSFAEKEIFDGPEVEEYLSEQFRDRDMSQYSALVLGCTHFNYFKPGFRRFIPAESRLIDGNLGTVRRLMSLTGLEETEDRKVWFPDTASLGNARTQYFFSGEKVEKEEILGHLQRLHNRLEEVRDL